MNTEAEARKLIVEQREHDRLVKEKMLERAEEEIKEPIAEEIAEEARELITEEREQAKQVRENMLSRAKEEIN